MSDIPIDQTVVPVTDKHLDDLYRDAVPIQAEQAKRWRSIATDRRTLLWLSIIFNIALVCTIMVMLPNYQQIPIFIYNGPDGLQVMSTTISELPPSVEVAGIEARLWFYLKSREAYNGIEADENYKIVSAMSDNVVRDQYQKWANPKANKNAPANLLAAKNGWIRVFKLPSSSAFITHTGDYSSGVYHINYCKVTYGGEGSGMLAQPMSEILDYHLVRRIPFLQRTTFNPEALIVTQYPGAEVLGPPHDVNLGALNPCGDLH